MSPDAATEQVAPPPSSPRRGGIIRLGLLLVVVVLIGWYVRAHWADFLVIRRLSAAALGAALLLDAMIYVYSAGAIRAAVGAFDVTVGVAEAMQLSLVTRFGNILTPLRGGSVVRAVYLKRARALSYPHFLVGMSGMLLAGVTVSMLCALGGLAYLWGATGRLMWQPMAVLAAALAAVLLLTLIRPRMAEGGSGARRQLAALVNGWRLLCGHGRCIAALLAVNALHVATMAAIYWLLLADMHRPAPWGIVLIIVSLGNISTIFQITPGNVGVYEAVLALLGPLVGLRATDMLAAAVAWRVLDGLLILVLGPVCGHLLARRAAA